MKRFTALLVSVVLVLSSSVALAVYFPSVSMIQYFLQRNSPDQIAASGPHTVELEGTISELYWCGTINHYEMILQVEDSKAAAPIGKDSPLLVVHFRLHVDPMPFQVGDVVEIHGTLNELYSSVMVPWVLADFINGSNNF